MQADTIVPNPSDPQSLNRYAYVRNNALRFVDPSGHGICDGPAGTANPDCYDYVYGDQEYLTWSDVYIPSNYGCGALSGTALACQDMDPVTKVIFFATFLYPFTAPYATESAALLGETGDAWGWKLTEWILRFPRLVRWLGWGATAATADGDPSDELRQFLAGREIYESRVRGIMEAAKRKLNEGQDLETVARWAYETRRALGATFKEITPEILQPYIFGRNIEKYGDPLGPSIEFLRGSGKSWWDIIESAARPGGTDIIPLLQRILE